MGEQHMTTPADTTLPAAPESATSPKPPTSPAQETDWKAMARQWEQRAKENAKAAESLAALQGEHERTTAELTGTRQATDQAKAEALRWRTAAKHGINDTDAETFLTGTDEATLTRQAERLAALAQGSTPAPPSTDISQGARPGAAITGGPEKDFADFLGNQLRQ